MYAIQIVRLPKVPTETSKTYFLWKNISPEHIIKPIMPEKLPIETEEFFVLWENFYQPDIAFPTNKMYIYSIKKKWDFLQKICKKKEKI